MKKTIIQILIIALISLNINSTYADYKYKIEDRIRINHIDEKVEKYLSNEKTAYYLAKKLKRKIEKLLDKTEKEIKDKYENKNLKYEDFKEYALTDIYWKIRIINNSVIKNKVEYFYPHYPKYYILENDYIKIITTDTGFTLNNKKLFWTRKDSAIFEYIEFFKLKPEEKTINYLESNFLNKEGKNKCKLIEYQNIFIKWSWYYFWLQEEFQSKEIYPWSTICPSEFTKWYSNNWISYFQRISTNILIYINAGQSYNWIDFWSMEIK